VKLYLDDNINDGVLASLLQKAGHSVVRPADVGLTGAPDAQHMTEAVNQVLVLLTKDTGDFTNLHNLILACGGSHPGIILVHLDGDATRDMRPKHIVAALGKLERSGYDLTDQLVILNQWR
jgi:predicted nuclease of predicted toxin-antitoxin system